jgi:hypothetical protein
LPVRQLIKTAKAGSKTTDFGTGSNAFENPGQDSGGNVEETANVL